jgi:hypothetical protein|tara:strand:+ start:73 stop:477 length:405 start_codon:yes stop_codon:yes gene_type:complete
MTKSTTSNQYSFAGHIRRIAEDWIVYAPIVGILFIAGESISPFALKDDIDRIETRLSGGEAQWVTYLEDEGRKWEAFDARLNIIYSEGLRTQLMILQAEQRGLEAQGVVVPLSITQKITDLNEVMNLIRASGVD